MRIGVVSYRFPPYNAIGAVSVGKTVKYLDRLGHEVFVLSATDQPLERSLDVEIDVERIAYTKWFNVSRLPEAVLGGRSRVTQTGFAPGTGPGRTVLKRLGRTFKAFVHVPDPQIGWYPFAVSEGRRCFAAFSPDVIFASAGPYTSLLVGARLATSMRVPWVAGFRDLWVDNPYRDDLPPVRQALDRRMEARVLSTASGIVTVSEPLANVLRAKYDTPVEVVSNGFDEDDYAHLDQQVMAPRSSGPLVITYTGMIIEGRRDPTALFRAINSLGLGPEDVRVRFFGRYLDPLSELAQREGVSGVVEINGPVAYRDALSLQRLSDVLLLLVWDDPREYGVVPGKLFEYLAARRPILSIGHVDGVPARLIGDRAAGIATNDPAVVAESLRSWLRQKRGGGIADLPATQTANLTRRAQTERLSSFLEQVARRCR